VNFSPESVALGDSNRIAHRRQDLSGLSRTAICPRLLGQIVVIDNLSAHKHPVVRERSRSAANDLLPELNSFENQGVPEGKQSQFG
jgi:hypothetical protein